MVETIERDKGVPPEGSCGRLLSGGPCTAVEVVADAAARARRGMRRSRYREHVSRPNEVTTKHLLAC